MGCFIAVIGLTLLLIASGNNNGLFVAIGLVMSLIGVAISLGENNKS